MPVANVAEVANVAVGTVVTIGRDFTHEYVVLTVPWENGRATAFLFTPAEAEEIISRVQDEIAIIRAIQGRTN
jgi:hypothetical protein